MNSILILVSIIALVELYRFWLSVKPHTKASHFKGKLEGTRRMRWDLEFKAAKTKQIREDIRKEYDFMKARMASIDNQLATFKGKKEDKAKILDDKTRAEADATRLEGQMAALDLEVYGSKPTAQYPDGHNGINQQIESFIELEGMLKNHIKSL